MTYLIQLQNPAIPISLYSINPDGYKYIIENKATFAEMNTPDYEF